MKIVKNTKDFDHIFLTKEDEILPNINILRKKSSIKDKKKNKSEKICDKKITEKEKINFLSEVSFKNKKEINEIYETISIMPTTTKQIEKSSTISILDRFNFLGTSENDAKSNFNKTNNVNETLQNFDMRSNINLNSITNLNTILNTNSNDNNNKEKNASKNKEKNKQTLQCKIELLFIYLFIS